MACPHNLLHLLCTWWTFTKTLGWSPPLVIVSPVAGPLPCSSTCSLWLSDYQNKPSFRLFLQSICLFMSRGKVTGRESLYQEWGHCDNYVVLRPLELACGRIMEDFGTLGEGSPRTLQECYQGWAQQLPHQGSSSAMHIGCFQEITEWHRLSPATQLCSAELS